MTLSLLTPPAIEPVSLQQAKAQLKLDIDDDNGLVTSLIEAARMRTEHYTRRALLTQSWIQWCDNWPSAPIMLAFPPLQAITAVTSYDMWDNAHVIDASLYRVENGDGGARLAFKEFVVPAFNLRRFDALSICYRCGYGDSQDDVPQAIRSAILAMITDLYAHRGDVALTPQTALSLLESFRAVSA